MRRFAIILATLSLAASAIWFGVWTVIAGRIEGAVANGLADAADQGFSLSCDGQEIGGFPLRFDVICGKIGARHAASGMRAALAGLRTATPLYRPWHSTADLASPLRLSGGPLRAPVEVTWSAAEISLEGGAPVPDRITFSATAARLLWQGRWTGAADITVKARINVPPDAVMGSAFDLRRTGLSIPELTIRLEIEGALIQASGPIRFDTSGIISGKLTMHIIGAEALPAYFRSLPAAARPVANAFVGGLLVLGTPATFEGREAKALVVAIDGGVLRMGPLALGRIPSLF